MLGIAIPVSSVRTRACNKYQAYHGPIVHMPTFSHRPVPNPRRFLNDIYIDQLPTTGTRATRARGCLPSPELLCFPDTPLAASVDSRLYTLSPSGQHEYPPVLSLPLDIGISLDCPQSTKTSQVQELLIEIRVGNIAYLHASSS
ncbi:hypothetical protein NEOLEDRAFT_77892 [Neolentinus lepideus HHB14362 ss-1]|uniref:Uncharacterized protein n=1 Tax=Neolentinus lepideus HHB14362 ss-1 TaxID=1314782 RepID=A0A165M622_9AGAM|nr:hypothetical protein NEOLEDRAFT_342127 [Neolentinus lepideus HHB14362 ss-1]KZT19083.1 hypothetical protein NEOLEDRAFT_77892 [Neolentinus lepideus HHB14362 ss-1]